MAKSKKEKNELEPHKGKARDGAAGKRGIVTVPTQLPPAALAAAAATAGMKRPRPATTRYPINLETFKSLKDEAEKIKVKAKRESTLIEDKGKKKTEKTVVPAPAAPSGEMAPMAPAAVGNFAGLTSTGMIPSDCTLAAGPQHVLAAVNSTFAIFRKTGGAALFQQRLTAWFANVITNATIFDPKAIYDQHSGRWVLLAVALPLDQSLNQSWFLISVSQTADPMGGWWNFIYDATKDGTTATNNWADYPCLGVDSQALYVTANMFRFGGGFQYAKLRIFPKANLYAGAATGFTDYVGLKNADGSMAFTIQPCHTYGAPQVEYFVNSLYPSATSSTKNTLSLWSLTNSLTAPSLTRRAVATDPYGMPPAAPQKGGGAPLDSGDVRMLNAVFRGGSVWSALTSFYNWGDGVNVASAQWFQINATSGALVQQGIFGAPRRSYCYPVVMPDSNGNMTMLFARVGSSEFASIGYTGRAASDTAGRLQASSILRAGAANYVSLDSIGLNRWGDYNGISCDPADGRTIWLFSEFASAVNDWSTWIGSARF
ncbi:MAG: hypothetical protein ACREAB_02250 [Blastocatellia bacterium]